MMGFGVARQCSCPFGKGSAEVDEVGHRLGAELWAAKRVLYKHALGQTSPGQQAGLYGRVR